MWWQRFDHCELLLLFIIRGSFFEHIHFFTDRTHILTHNRLFYFLLRIHLIGLLAENHIIFSRRSYYFNLRVVVDSYLRLRTFRSISRGELNRLLAMWLSTIDLFQYFLYCRANNCDNRSFIGFFLQQTRQKFFNRRSQILISHFKRSFQYFVENFFIVLPRVKRRSMQNLVENDS